MIEDDDVKIVKKTADGDSRNIESNNKNTY